jgi:hypothetical protein
MEPVKTWETEIEWLETCLGISHLGDCRQIGIIFVFMKFIRSVHFAQSLIVLLYSRIYFLLKETQDLSLIFTTLKYEMWKKI